MHQEWGTISVSEIAAKEKYSLCGGPFGSKLGRKDYVPEGVPVIRGSNLSTDGTFSFEDFVFVSDQKADELIANTAYPGDLVFTQRGTLGQVGILPKESEYSRFIVSQSQMKLTVDTEKMNSYFVFLHFRLPATVEAIKNRSITSGVPHINLEIFSKLQVPCPPLNVQEQIVKIISAYDDLIDNNNRRIALLEEATHRLYQEWFVHLRFPGHEHTPVVAGVPKGWEKRPLQKVGFLNYGKSLPKRDREDGEVPVYGSSGVVGTHNKALIPGPSIIVGRKGNVGSIFWCDRSSFPIDTVFYIAPEQSSVFLYLNLKHQNFINTDAAVPGLNRNYAHKLPVLMPTERLLAQFEEMAIPIHKQITTLQTYNAKLAEARDALLPRLMNGSLAV